MYTVQDGTNSAVNKHFMTGTKENSEFNLFPLVFISGNIKGGRQTKLSVSCEASH